MKSLLNLFSDMYLTVVGIVNGVDSSADAVPFKTVTFQCRKTLGKKDHAIKGLLVRNFWPQKYQRTIQGIKTDMRGDAEFNMLAIGDTFAGGMFQCETTPYSINGGPSITTWKGLVFEGENALVVAARNLRQNNACPKFVDPETDTVEVFKLQTVQGSNSASGGATPKVVGPDLSAATPPVTEPVVEKVEP